jgi:hypothetical protein
MAACDSAAEFHDETGLPGQSFMMDVEEQSSAKF